MFHGPPGPPSSAIREIAAVCIAHVVVILMLRWLKKAGFGCGIPGISATWYSARYPHLMVMFRETRRNVGLGPQSVRASCSAKPDVPWLNANWGFSCAETSLGWTALAAPPGPLDAHGSRSPSVDTGTPDGREAAPTAESLFPFPLRGRYGATGTAWLVPVPYTCGAGHTSGDWAVAIGKFLPCTGELLRIYQCRAFALMADFSQFTLIFMPIPHRTRDSLSNATALVGGLSAARCDGCVSRTCSRKCLTGHDTPTPTGL